MLKSKSEDKSSKQPPPAKPHVHVSEDECRRCKKLGLTTIVCEECYPTHKQSHDNTPGLKAATAANSNG